MMESDEVASETVALHPDLSPSEQAMLDASWRSAEVIKDYRHLRVNDIDSLGTAAPIPTITAAMNAALTTPKESAGFINALQDHSPQSTADHRLSWYQCDTLVRHYLYQWANQEGVRVHENYDGLMRMATTLPGLGLRTRLLLLGVIPQQIWDRLLAVSDANHHHCHAWVTLGGMRVLWHLPDGYEYLASAKADKANDPRLAEHKERLLRAEAWLKQGSRQRWRMGQWLGMLLLAVAAAAVGYFLGFKLVIMALVAAMAVALLLITASSMLCPNRYGSDYGCGSACLRSISHVFCCGLGVPDETGLDQTQLSRPMTRGDADALVTMLRARCPVSAVDHHLRGLQQKLSDWQRELGQGETQAQKDRKDPDAWAKPLTESTPSPTFKEKGAWAEMTPIADERRFHDFRGRCIRSQIGQLNRAIAARSWLPCLFRTRPSAAFASHGGGRRLGIAKRGP